MPFIPIIRPQEQQAAPAVSGAVVQAPQANFSGVNQALGQLANAGQQDMIPVQPFTAPGRGLEIAGEAVAGVGDLMAKLQIEEGKARTDLQVAEAQNALDMEYARYAERMQAMPLDSWLEEWDAKAGEAITTVLDSDRLTPAARERIALYGTKWKGDTATRIAVNRIQVTSQRAAESIKIGFDRLRKEGRIDEARDGLQKINARPPSWWSPADSYDQEQRNEAAAQEQEFNRQYDAIKANPRGWLTANKSRPSEMSASKFEQLTNLAQQTRRESVADDVDRFEDAVAGGQITGPEGVDAWERDNPNIRKAVREQLKATVIRRNNAYEKERVRANAPEIASRLLSEIQALDPDMAQDADFTELSNRINELPEGYKNYPRIRLNRKWRKYDGEDAEEEKSMLAFGEKLLGSMLESKAFGDYDVPIKVQKRVPGTDEFEDVDELRRDPLKWEEALKNKEVIGGRFRRWLENQKDPTPEQVQKKIYEFMPDAKRASLLDLFDGSPAMTPSLPQADLPPPRESPDGLPDNPGPAENTLFQIR